MSGAWIQAAKATPVLNVAQEVGLARGRMGSFGPCPACGEDSRSRNDRRGACGVTGDGRGWKCHRCSATGDGVDIVARKQFGHRSADCNGAEWTILRTWFAERGWATHAGDRPRIDTAEGLLGRRCPKAKPAQGQEEGETEDAAGSGGPAGGPSAGGPFGWRLGLAEECAERLWADEGAPVLQYLLDDRRLPEASVRAFRLGAALVRGEPWLTIPLLDASERVVNVRFRSIPPTDKAYRVCPGRPLPLYGADRLGTDLAGPVIVTEGELDVVAMHAYGYTASVVSGTAGAGAWKDEWLDMLEPYDHFLAAYDDDDAGEAGAKAFAEKMGMERCSRVVLPKKDAGECLQAGTPVESVARCIQLAKPMFGVEVRRLTDWHADLERLIRNPQELVGIPTRSALLNRAIGGLRPGLSVISGDTGKGKSTMGHWILQCLAEDGIPVLAMPLENRPIAAVQKHLRMQLGGDFLRVTEDDRRRALEELGQLPLYMLDHYGHLAPKQAITTLRYAARRLGVRAVLVDHLGFLVDPEAEDERRAIEAIIRALAVTAYTYSLWIGLVCHPRALPQGATRPTMNELKGASAIKQDASEVLIVEADPPRPNARPPRDWPAAIVHVEKVRSEYGISGSSATLAFGPLSCRYGDAWEDVPEGLSGQLVLDPMAYV